jgi:ABC-type polar amino acid transport system ATPase subunit
MSDNSQSMRRAAPWPVEIEQGNSGSRPNQPAAVEAAALNKWFGSFHALKNIDLAVPQGARIVICGPSGSGKSTLIRCVNGLETFQSGAIRIGGVDLTRDQKQLHPGPECLTHNERRVFKILRAYG